MASLVRYFEPYPLLHLRTVYGRKLRMIITYTKSVWFVPPERLKYVWSPPWHLSICYWQIFWHSIWHIFWHSIWHSIWHIFWHSTWHIFWHMFWHIFWHSIRHSIWHSIWHILWHSIWPLRSSGAHWAGKVPGWGPAVHTELGRSQVEVQRCTMSWEGPRLRSSGAHWAGKVPGWGPEAEEEEEDNSSDKI